jgi:hypothetical protein
VVFSPQANYTDRASDRRLSAKLMPTFADRGCRVVSATDLPAVNSVFLTRCTAENKIKVNKKFWEELIATFFSYDKDRIENDT